MTTNPQLKSELCALTFSEFMAANLPPRRPIITPWLAERELAMIVGERGIGKTYFLLALAMAIALGRPTMGWEITAPCKVLYIDGEMQGSAIKKRLEELVRGFVKGSLSDEHFSLLDTNFRIITPDTQPDELLLPDISKQKSHYDLAHLVEWAQVIILDNLSCLCPSAAGNDPEPWIPVQSWLLKMRRAGKGVIFAHHTNKSGDQHGHSEKERHLDVVIKLTRPHKFHDTNEGARFTATFTKSRHLVGDESDTIDVILKSEGDASWFERTMLDKVRAAVEMKKQGNSLAEIGVLLGLGTGEAAKSKVRRLIARGNKEGCSLDESEAKLNSTAADGSTEEE